MSLSILQTYEIKLKFELSFNLGLGTQTHTQNPKFAKKSFCKNILDVRPLQLFLFSVNMKLYSVR
jgi:hypothetical protein